MQSEKNGISGRAGLAVYGEEIIFTGIIVGMSQLSISHESICSKGDHCVGQSLRVALQQIQQLLHRRPVLTVRVLLDWRSSTSRMDIEKALPLSGYMFKDGPWKKALIKFGVDPRLRTDFRFYQTVTFTMNFNPIIKRREHDWDKIAERAFPQFLKGEDNVSHVFEGRKFMPHDTSWQICDINNVLLQGIAAKAEIRSVANFHDGFFWNGTMAELEVIMREKLLCIRDGGTPDDEN
ncbi:Transcription factor IIIC subunit 5 [Penicillium malachiteum]|nr:Transcription factor IIIC subunit 5 [Penicillium malachiteum]